MPYPFEYVRATEEFAAFLVDVRDLSHFGSSHQAYTTAQGVFHVFRRRLSLADAIRFAGVLPVGLRALFVADWDPDEKKQDFTDREQMSKEVRELRPDHNFSTDWSIGDVAEALRRHVDPDNLEVVLSRLPEGASDFWATGHGHRTSRDGSGR